jgi:uncharacterized RDD family membrane protein YckC
MDKQNNMPQIRPWVRYFARLIDLLFVGAVFGLILVSLFPTKTFDETGLSFILILAWVFAEAQLLSTWGYTPGKWLLKVKVRNPLGEKLEFADALMRSFLVWIMGLGFGLFSVITMPISYFQLKRNSITTWDRRVGSIVSHEELGVLRITIFAVIFLGYILMLAISGMQAANDFILTK